MGIELRPYQVNGIAEVKRVLSSGKRAPILIAPTGSGKTVVASAIIESAVSKGKRVLFLAHRIELISQAAMKLAQFGIEHRVIAPSDAVRRMKIQQFRELNRSYVNPLAAVSVGTVQTVSRRLAMQPPDIIIIDECHLSIAPTYQKCVAEFPRAIVLGLTATPTRLDGRGLGEMYDAMVKLAEPQEIADMWFLVPMRFFAAAHLPDLSGIKKVRGDYDQKGLAEAVDKPALIGDAVDHYRRVARGRPAMAFCVSIKHAEDTAAAFVAAGYRAVATSGNTSDDDRAGHIAGLANGTIDVVCNCALYIEGLDCPVISCIILLAPTQSLPRYLQSVGRGSRPAPGKRDCIVLDHAGNCRRHGFPYDSREWSLDGAVTRTRSASDEPDVTIATCPECFTVHEPAPQCPACGYIYPAKVRKLIQEEGELVEITASEQVRLKLEQEEAKRRESLERKRQEARADTLDALIELAKSRGYRYPEAWAKHRIAGRARKKAFTE